MLLRPEHLSEKNEEIVKKSFPHAILNVIVCHYNKCKVTLSKLSTEDRNYHLIFLFFHWECIMLPVLSVPL